MTRRALTTSPNDLLRKAERKPLRKSIVKKKKKSSKEIEVEKAEEEAREEEERKRLENEEEEKKKRRREKPILERSVTRSIAAKTKDGISTRNRKYTLVEKTALKIVQKSKRSLKTRRPNDVKCRTPSSSSSSSVVVGPSLSPIVKIVNESLSAQISLPCNHIDMDLTCHEKVISPDNIASTSFHPPQQQRKNRRKPLHVFKSLPNPAIEPPSTKLNEEYKDIDQIAPPLTCLLYTSPSPRDGLLSRMPSSA